MDAYSLATNSLLLMGGASTDANKKSEWWLVHVKYIKNEIEMTYSFKHHPRASNIS